MRIADHISPLANHIIYKIEQRVCFLRWACANLQWGCKNCIFLFADWARSSDVFAAMLMSLNSAQAFGDDLLNTDTHTRHKVSGGLIGANSWIIIWRPDFLCAATARCIYYLSIIFAPPQSPASEFHKYFSRARVVIAAQPAGELYTVSSHRKI